MAKNEGAQSSGEEGNALGSNKRVIASPDFFECKVRLSRSGAKLCLALTLALSCFGLIVLALGWSLGMATAANGSHAGRSLPPGVRAALQGTTKSIKHRTTKPAASQTPDEFSPQGGAPDTQGFHCPQGAAAEEQPVDTQLFNDPKVVHHPNGLTFRTAVFEDNQFGSRSAQFQREKSERIESGVWEADQDPYMQKAFNSDPNCEYPLFLDGGAAFGFYSLLAMRMHPCRRVHAFNPHPRFAYAMGLNLQDNDQAQRLDSDNACINRMALASHTGSVQFNFGYGGGIGVGDRTKAVTVPMTNLDTFFDEHVPHDMKVILVKLDVEGQELEVMKGATKVLTGCRVKYWAIGIHKQNLLEPVRKILQQNGYTITRAIWAVAGQPNGEVLANC